MARTFWLLFWIASFAALWGEFDLLAGGSTIFPYKLIERKDVQRKDVQSTARSAPSEAVRGTRSPDAAIEGGFTHERPAEAPLGETTRAVATRAQDDVAKRQDIDRLQAALAAAQAKAERADHDKTAAVAALHASETTDADHRAKLDDAQKRTASLVDELADAKRGAAQTTDAAKHLLGDRAEAGALRAALISAQTKMGDADREKEAAVAALHAAETTDADHQAKLAGAKQRVAELTDELADAKRAAALTTEALKRSERTQRRALAGAQAKADQAVRDKTTAVVALHASESADADHQARLVGAEEKVASLSDDLAASKRVVAQAREMSNRLSEKQVQGSKLQPALAAAQAEAGQVARDKTDAVAALHTAAIVDADHRAKLADARRQVASLSDALAGAKRPGQATETTKRSEQVGDRGRAASSSSDQSATGQGLRLPDGGIVHVILRYPRSGTAARSQAMAVKSQLETLGLDISASSGDFKERPDLHVAYYYKQDESVALGIATRIKAPEPIRTRISTDRLPRPGTIEVSSGGPRQESEVSP